MTKKNIFKFYKKLISLALIVALLWNSNAYSFAQSIGEVKGYESLKAEIGALVKGDIQGELSTGSVGKEIEEICKGLGLCIMLEGKELEWGEGSEVNLLYLGDEEIKQIVEAEYGKGIEIDGEKLKEAREKEKGILNGYKERAKVIWTNKRKQLEGEELVKYLRSLIPALYLADKGDKGFEGFAKGAYSSYLVNLNKELKSERAISKVLEGNKTSKQAEYLGLGDIIYGYGIVNKGLAKNSVVDEIAYKGAISELSTIVVPAYISVLLAQGDYSRIGNYIKGLGYYEISHSDGHSENWFNGLMDMFMPGSYIKMNWGNLSSYAPGPVSRNGYYRAGEEIRNIWEEIPGIIVSYGEEGEELINEIFYEGLRLGHEGRMKPHARWERGVLIPFIIGSIGTNKIKARAHQDIAKGTGMEYAWAKEFGANIVGMVELGLMDYKFYDVPNYGYYKRVREVISGPYWKEIEAVKSGTEAGLQMGRRNFDIQAHTDRQIKAGWFVGSIYNESNNTGLIIGESESAWESGRNVLAAELKIAGLADLVASVYYTYGLAVSIAGLGQMVRNGVNLLKAAKSLREIGEKGSLIKIAKGIRKGRYDYLIKKPSAKVGGRSKATPKTAEWKPSTVEVMNYGEGAIETGVYNTASGEVTNVGKIRTTNQRVATVGEGASGSSGARAEEALNGIRTRSKRLRTSREVNRQVLEMEAETLAAEGKTGASNNIFKKPYSEMNPLEKKVMDIYIKAELNWLGDLKAVIKDSKSLFTTRTGLKNTAASGLSVGIGEAPAVEARVMTKAPTEIVANAQRGNIFENPVTIFDNIGVNGQIGSSGRGVRNMPNSFKGAGLTPVTLRQPGFLVTNLNTGLVAIRNTFIAPEGENPLLTSQLAPMRRAAAVAGLLVGTGLTAAYGLPAVIGTTLAMAPLAVTNINPQNSQNSEQNNPKKNNNSSHGLWNRIFGNKNSAKANLNLTQQELQNFVNAFTAFIAKDDVSEEGLLNFLREQSIQPVTSTQVEHGTAGNDYEKTYKDFLAAFNALDFTKDPDEIARQFAFNTGIDRFKYGGQILIKKGTATKDGTVTEDFQRINTVFVSAKDFKLKDNESLVMDSYGNIYKLTVKNGKETKEYFQDVIATQVNVPGLDMPIVVIGKTINKLAVLNFLFMLMGFSSLGRFVNGPIQDLWPELPDVVAMALGTGIYFTNLLAVPFKPLIDKLGAKKMVAFAIGEIITASLLPTLFGMSGFAAINPTATKLAVLAITSVLYGSAAAGLQQVVNTTANNMLGGKEAGYVTAGGQMYKSIGSLSTYLFYAAAVGILGAQWPAMYWLMGIPGVIGAVLLGLSDLPLQKSKAERLQEAAAQGDEAAIAELEAMNNGQTAATPKNGNRDWDFILSWGGLPILAAIMMLCGSETLVSVTTKDLMKGWLNNITFFDNDALQMAITGIITMGPALAGRLLAKSLMKKYKDVPQYNQKMLLIAAAVATASAAAIKLLGPSAGLYGLLFVITSNMTLSNFFTFEANIMKKYNNEKFDGKFDSLVGTLTTMGIVGCFLVPTLASSIFPETATAFDKLIVPMLLIPAAMAIMLPHMRGANPFRWNTPMKQKDIEAMSREIATDIEEAMANISDEDVAQTMAEIKTDMAAELGISEEEVETFLATGTLPNLSEENINKLADFWGITNRDMKQFLRGENRDIILERIQNNMQQKFQQTMDDINITVTQEDIEQIFAH